MPRSHEVVSNLFSSHWWLLLCAPLAPILHQDMFDDPSEISRRRGASRSACL